MDEELELIKPLDMCQSKEEIETTVSLMFEYEGIEENEKISYLEQAEVLEKSKKAPSDFIELLRNAHEMLKEYENE